MAAEAAGGGGTPVVPEAEEPQLQPPAGNSGACASNMSRKRKAEADQEVQDQEKQDANDTNEPHNTSSHLAGSTSGGASASGGGNTMDPSAVGTVGARNADDKDDEGVANHRSEWEALLGSFNFTPEQEAQLPAIRQGAERLFSDYEDLWRMEEPGKPLSEMPPIPMPDFSRFSRVYKGPEDDEAFGFTGPYGDWVRNGQDLAAIIGPFMLLKQFAGVPPSLPKWVVPPASIGCDIPWEEPDLSTPAGVAAMEKMKEEIEAWRNS